MESNRDTALRFFRTLNSMTEGDKKKDAVLGFFNEDSIFDNIPLEPARSPEEIWKFLDLEASRVDWVIHSLAETDDGLVLSERTDRFLIEGRWVEYPVMGAMQIANAKILTWRDYFDTAQCAGQTHARPRPRRSLLAEQP